MTRRFGPLCFAFTMASGCGDPTGPAPLRPEIDLVVVAPLAGGGTHLAGLRVDGSGLVDLTPDVPAARWPAWDRAGARLLYTNGPTIRVLEADGDRALVDVEPTLSFVILSPQWSPDGGIVAFLGDGVLYIVPQQGGEPTAISPPGASCRTPPSWSPDGTRLVALCGRSVDPYGWIWAPHVVAADGSTFDLVGSPDVAGEIEWGAPVWSPIRDEIAVATIRASTSTRGPTYAVTVLRPDGGIVREVPAAGPTGTPAWTPDGRRFAFAVGNPWTSGNNLTVYRLATDERMVLPMPDGTWAREPAWSPRGDALAFAQAEGTSGATVRVWRFGESGGVTRPTLLLAESPAWRPR